MSGRARSIVLVVLTVLAAPVALAFETLLRRSCFPADFELVRAFLEPWMTPVGWLLALASVLAGLAGVVAQSRLVARRLARLVPYAPAEHREAIRQQVFILTASIPQIPAIAATFAFTFGASIVPTSASIGISTISVLAQGLALVAATARTEVS